MKLSDQTKILILIAIIAIVIFFFLQHRSNRDEVTHNQGSLTHNLTTNKDDKDDNENDENDDENLYVTGEGEEEEKKYIKSNIKNASKSKNESPESNVNVLKKFRTRNSSKNGEFSNSNYVDGKRGGRASDLDKFFEDGHPLDEKVGFQKNESNVGDVQYANYIPGKQRKMRDVDKFNADAMLPKEKHKDWFDDPYESTSVKNTHLINIYRPIGINTIQTTLKNANRQLRADPACPKYAISPFLNSSVEPDTNIRSQSLCN
jgi:hypothetical protein